MTSPWVILLILIALVIVVIVSYIVWPSKCPTEIHTNPDGSIILKPTGKAFENMKAFQQWWLKSEFNGNCPVPVSIGKGGRNVVDKHELPPEKEKTYATTPINKVDDYEFSRIFGREEHGRMINDKEDYNIILFDRTQDWVNKPYSSEERKQIAGRISTTEAFSGNMDTKQKMVQDIVLKAYSSETDYEPVITQVGENNWEVNELKPKRTSEPTIEMDSRNMDIDAHTSFKYRDSHDVSSAIDPYFASLSSPSGLYGPTPNEIIPGMERMFGPTFDTTKWV
jgi:hypothetical protein